MGCRVLSLRQGANSASTAKVTRMRMDDSKWRRKAAATILDAEPKPGHYKTLGCGGAGHAPGAAFGDVAIGFVPAHGAFERSGDRARLETQFELRARAIHKHHVARDLH